MRTESRGNHHPIWPLQDAKARFSEMIRASAKEPQFVSIRGEEEAVVLSKKEYDRILGKKPSFLEFINQSPLKGLELNIKRDNSLPREIDL